MYSPNCDSTQRLVTPYQAGAGKPLSAPSLAGDLDTDIAVIGGGIAGNSLALHAAEKGSRVILLEAKEIGWGASSRNSGHVAPATKQEPQDILKRYAAPYGERLLEAAREGPALAFALAEKHGMNASVARTGVISAANTLAGRDVLARRTEFLRARGYDVSFLGRIATADLIGSDSNYYFGCSLDRHGGTLNPLAYVRGLARAAVAAGTVVFENSPAERLVREGGRWVISTAHGTVRAEFVGLCTNAYTDDICPALRASIVPVRAYQFMTKPLPPEIRATVLKGRQGLTDMRRLMSGIRMHDDGRLHFSGQGPLFGPETPPFVEVSLRRIREVFPQVGAVELDYWWSGWMAMNWENAWKIHELAPGLVAALGCNGRGVALATTLGRELAKFMCGMPESALVMPFVPVRRIVGHAIHPLLVNALVAYYKLRDTLDERFAATASAKASPDERGCVT